MLVELTSLPGATLAGFIIQARRVDGDFISGTFEIAEGDLEARYLKCVNQARTSVTHTHSEPKTSVSVKWKAPADFTGGEVKIFATVARVNILFLGLKTFLKEVEFPSLKGGVAEDRVTRRCERC